MLDVSLSLSFRRRFLELAAPEELRLLEATTEEWCRWLEPDERDTITFVAEGLGDRRSLGGWGGDKVSKCLVNPSSADLLQPLQTFLCQIRNSRGGNHSFKWCTETTNQFQEQNQIILLEG